MELRHRWSPQRSMQRADAAWAARQGGVEEERIWEVAIDRCRIATVERHETRFAGRSSADQAVLRILAGDALFGRRADVLSLSRSSAQQARHRLVDRGQLVRRGDRLQVVDPLYADWIRTRFPI